MRGVWTALVVSACLASSAPAQEGALPPSTLAVQDNRGGWRTLWTSDAAPVRWAGPLLSSRITWHPGANGVQWGELVLAGGGEAWRTRLVVARLDPSRVRFRLDTAFAADRAPAWTLARAISPVVLAVNAGQFESTMPWGWVVLDGRPWLPAQHGPLAPALLQDSSGALRWIAGDSVAAAMGSSHARWAFQSYPALLQHDSVVAPLRAAGRGVSVTHRDARLAICLADDGRVVIALTRFDALGRWLGFIPFGLTAPEMAGIMGALGCRDAMLLDGGISARLRVRGARGVAHDWEGIRSVPLALVAEPLR